MENQENNVDLKLKRFVENIERLEEDKKEIIEFTKIKARKPL